MQNSINESEAGQEALSMIQRLRMQPLTNQGRYDAACIIDDIELEVKKMADEIAELKTPQSKEPGYSVSTSIKSCDYSLRDAKIDVLSHLIKSGVVRLDGSNRERQEMVNALCASFEFIDAPKDERLNLNKGENNPFGDLRFGDLCITGCEPVPGRKSLSIYSRSCYENNKFIGHVYYGVSQNEYGEKSYSELDVINVVRAVKNNAPEVGETSWRKGS
ncbi:hypothetical protein OL205_000250 [Salmonella enterica]|nr:hypothetical protein [Salmonella enterica]